MALLFEHPTNQIIACAFAVQGQLGPGFLEKIYEEALCLELGKAKLRYDRQRQIDILYDGKMIGWHRLDLAIEDRVIVELKAIKSIEPVHSAILRSYLKASGLIVGLILNFAKPAVEIKRVIHTSGWMVNSTEKQKDG